MVCGDDPIGARLAERNGAITYGVSEGVDVRAVDVTATTGAFTFGIVRDGERVVDVELPLRGVHNVVNATGAAAMALAVGVEPDTHREGPGQVRRCRAVDSTSAASTVVRPSSTTTPICRPRSPPCWLRPVAAATAGSA